MHIQGGVGGWTHAAELPAEGRVQPLPVPKLPHGETIRLSPDLRDLGA
jgi:hypothetical protein